MNKRDSCQGVRILYAMSSYVTEEERLAYASIRTTESSASFTRSSPALLSRSATTKMLKGTVSDCAVEGRKKTLARPHTLNTLASLTRINKFSRGDIKPSTRK